jgi:hypothetical protein
MRNKWVVLALVASACTRPAPAPGPAALPSEAAGAGTVQVTGTLRVVGSAPVNSQVVVQKDDGPGMEITGPLRAELAQLSGAVVEVTGRVRGTALEAEEYTIRSVDGAPVVMGVVERGATALQLRVPDGSVVALRGATGQFRVGQKVWVQGPRTVEVQSYGLIQP